MTAYYWDYNHIWYKINEFSVTEVLNKFLFGGGGQQPLLGSGPHHSRGIFFRDLRRDLYWQHTTLITDRHMPPVGYEPTVSAGERPQTYALDRAATGTGNKIP